MFPCEFYFSVNIFRENTIWNSCTHKQQNDLLKPLQQGNIWSNKQTGFKENGLEHLAR